MGWPLADTGSVTEDTNVTGGLLTATGDANFFLTNDTGQWTAETIAGAYGSQLVIDQDGVWTYTADNSDPTIQALNTGQSIQEVFTVTASSGQTTITITINGLDEPPCFTAGTPIETPYGPRPVESIRPGDLVLTSDGGALPVSWHGTVTLDTGAYADPGQVLPVRVCRDALAPGVPDRDILFSPMHRVLLASPQLQLLFGDSEVLCPIRHLVNGVTIFQEALPEVSYHHLMLPRHHLLLAAGCESESFYPGRIGLTGFDERTREEMFSFFPALRAEPEQYGATVRRVLTGHEARLVADSLLPGDARMRRSIARAA